MRWVPRFVGAGEGNPLCRLHPSCGIVSVCADGLIAVGRCLLSFDSLSGGGWQAGGVGGEGANASPTCHVFGTGISTNLATLAQAYRDRLRARRRKAKCQKGYDQAERLAKALGKICGIRVVEALCRTTSEAKEQKQLNRAQRWKASQNAYGAGQEIEAVANAFVLLVDDVLTSGATLSGCGTILKENGADAICALTIAYTNENQKNRKDEET